MIIFVAAALYFTIIHNQPISTETAIPKFLLTAILIGVARWTAKLQRSHLEESRKYKRLSLELQTISPFIATLDENEQRQITKQLVDRYFVGKANDGSNSTSDDDAFKNPIESITEVVKKININKE